MRERRRGKENAKNPLPKQRLLRFGRGFVRPCHLGTGHFEGQECPRFMGYSFFLPNKSPAIPPTALLTVLSSVSKPSRNMESIFL